MPPVDDESDTLASKGATKASGSWLQAMEASSEEEGYLEPLGDRHWAFFLDDSTTLLVTFESAADIRARPGNMPRGYHIALARRWSHLCIIADGPTWYRDRRVYGYFDRLVDDGFLEDFDRVVFYGAGGMAGYAAAAFSVTAPGATVVAVAPRATMDADLASWDDRNPETRRMVFTDRYGFAPDMTEGAGPVFVIYDPHHAPDAMHATLFARPHITRLPMRQTGSASATIVEATGMAEALLDAAMAGKLDRSGFDRIWRAARRGHAPYLLALRDDNAAQGKAVRAACLDRYGVLRRKSAGGALLSTAPANTDNRPKG
jgi:hypothetical protein